MHINIIWKFLYFDFLNGKNISYDAICLYGTLEVAFSYLSPVLYGMCNMMPMNVYIYIYI